jgi:hypothetical protein
VIALDLHTLLQSYLRAPFAYVRAFDFGSTQAVRNAYTSDLVYSPSVRRECFAVVFSFCLFIGFSVCCVAFAACI